jgi:hypothetical protein
VRAGTVGGEGGKQRDEREQASTHGPMFAARPDGPPLRSLRLRPKGAL